MVAKQGDTIKWIMSDNCGELSNKEFTAKVAIVDHSERYYGVYAEYGQDLIPFDKAEIIKHSNSPFN